MKFTTEHLEELREAVSVHDTQERRRRYTAGDFPRADSVQDIDKRYRWDLFWHVNAVRNQNIGQHFFSLWDGKYTDIHIDTALRSIVPPLQKEI